MRALHRRVRTIAALLAMAAGTVSLVAGSTPAGAQGDGGGNGIDVVTVEGLLDPPNLSLVRDAVRAANDDDATLLVVQLDSSGGLDVDVSDVVDEIRASEVPVAVWVGPSGSSASGAATLLAEAAHVLVISQGSTIGAADPVTLDDPGDPPRAEVADELARLAAAGGRDPEAARRAAAERFGAEEALEAGLVDAVEPIVGEVIVSLDGRTVRTAAGDVELSTATVVGEGRDRRRQPDEEVHFGRLGLTGEVQHTLNSPSVAYLLLVAGLALVVFEFFAASVGIAGVVGAVALVGAFTGFSHLPVQWWAVALVLLGILGFSIDVQAGVLGFWSAFGLVALAAGSITLYGGSSRLDPPWWELLLVCLGAATFMVGAMTAVIRSRFATPTIGREAMVGAMGRAETTVDPDGVVVIDEAYWRARTNRATPIAAGDAVRVVSVEGLVLEVEPEEGGARDYRDRARERRAQRGRRDG